MRTVDDSTHVELCWHGKEAHSSKSQSHRPPKRIVHASSNLGGNAYAHIPFAVPAGQRHVNLPIGTSGSTPDSMQVPPWRHGETAHSSVSWSQVSPEKPSAQKHS